MALGRKEEGQEDKTQKEATDSRVVCRVQRAAKQNIMKQGKYSTQKIHKYNCYNNNCEYISKFVCVFVFTSANNCAST